MGRIGQEYATPKAYLKKVDLSHSRLSHLRDGEFRSRRQQVATLDRQAILKDEYLASRPERLVHVLIKYLCLGHPLIDASANANGDDASPSGYNIATDESLAYLECRGFDLTDLMSWKWILTARTLNIAVARMALLDKQVPVFVFLLLLRRPNPRTGTLRLLVDRAGAVLTASKSQRQRYTQHSYRTLMIVIVRLLRQSQRLWPAAHLKIAAIATSFMNAPLHDAKPEQTSIVLTRLFNRILNLLSLPCAHHPFQSVIYQQQAQFNVLRKMHAFKPPLIINREGYQALTRVQLAHKKTVRERHWAEMKAKSWPPWKEDKLGITASIGPEHGVSRAMEIIVRLGGAGYDNRHWGQVVRILAGWDTDHSPTIQTRAWLHDPSQSRYRAISSQVKQASKQQSEIWAARITATRTLEEAWACFLSYKDDSNVRASQKIYFAMMEKLTFEERRLKQRKRRNEHKIAEPNHGKRIEVMPGDGKEVTPKSESPFEGTYVRTVPPHSGEFFEAMLRDGAKPGGRFLAFLLINAPSLKAGIHYLRNSVLPKQVLNALTNTKYARTPEGTATLRDQSRLPDFLFAAFIHLLSRFSPTSSHGLGKYVFKNERGKYRNQFQHACHLMELRRPLYRPPWNSLFAYLGNSKATIELPLLLRNHEGQGIETWNKSCELLKQMHQNDLEVDFVGFTYLCWGFEKAIFASSELAEEHVYPYALVRANFALNEYRKKATVALATGLPMLKSLFETIVGVHVFSTSPNLPNSNSGFARTHSPDTAAKSNSHPPSDQSQFDTTSLPRLLEIPSLATLHTFIRILGLRRDYTGLLELVEWMAEFAPELQQAGEEVMNNPVMQRRCLCAVRAFLERGWMREEEGANLEEGEGVVDDDDNGGDSGDDGDVGAEVKGESNLGANEVMVRRIREIVDSHEWGGWPTDGEVVRYCRRGRFL